MTWELLLPIIARYGFEVAATLARIITTHPVPTPAAWDQLAADVKTYDQLLAEAIARANKPNP